MKTSRPLRSYYFRQGKDIHEQVLYRCSPPYWYEDNDFNCIRSTDRGSSKTYYPKFEDLIRAYVNLKKSTWDEHLIEIGVE